MTSRISILKVFYKVFNHIWLSIKYNFGLNYLAAGALTYIIVKSGMDWMWYSFSHAHIWIFYAGFISVFAGFLLPVIIPLSLYFSKDRVKQIAGLADCRSSLHPTGHQLFCNSHI